MWSADEQPRERLLKNGSAELSVNELLAVILRSGKQGESALDLARHILSDCDNKLHNLARLQVADLIKGYKGIGIAKASGLVAAVELGRRHALETASVTEPLSSSWDVYLHIAPILKDLDHEEFWVIYLNQQKKVIGKGKIAEGGLTSARIDVKLLFKKALEMKACGIIIAHNHPSGSIVPGIDDKRTTDKIKHAGRLLDIPLHDHLIIGGEEYYSFRDENAL
ncbi:DNA repair protein RadC [Bacteroidia bacterium]|nr:DNA repair protein RadC [Bacteroidia bacterium]